MTSKRIKDGRLLMPYGTIKRRPPLEIIRDLELKHHIKIEIKDNLYYVYDRDKALLFIAHTLSALERNMKIKERIK